MQEGEYALTCAEQTLYIYEVVLTGLYSHIYAGRCVRILSGKAVFTGL